jgi:hypothetical protein
MANTLSASLILDTVSKRTQTTLGHVFAPLGAFASDFSEDVMNQGQSVQIPLASAGATAQTNPTNWESGDTTVGNVPVAVAGYSVSFHITPLQMNNSFRLQQLVDINLQSFVNKVMDVAMAPLNGTHWTNFIQAASTFTADNLKTIWGGIARSPVKNIILDGTVYSKFLPTTLEDIGSRAGMSGFDGFYLNSRWTGAGTNVIGFAGGPQSLAFVAGLPNYDDETRADINATTISVPLGNSGKSLAVLASTWLSRATRTRWASWDIMFGASKLDNTQGYLLKSGGSA